MSMSSNLNAQKFLKFLIALTSVIASGKDDLLGFFGSFGGEICIQVNQQYSLHSRTRAFGLSLVKCMSYLLVCLYCHCVACFKTFTCCFALTLESSFRGLFEICLKEALC